MSANPTLSRRFKRLNPDARLLLSALLGAVAFLVIPGWLGAEVSWLAKAVWSFLQRIRRIISILCISRSRWVSRPKLRMFQLAVVRCVV